MGISHNHAATPRPRPTICDIDVYVPGDAHSTARNVFKLSSNETPLGPSPNAVEAYRANAGELRLYPDSSSRRLREAIGVVCDLDPVHIVCGHGSDEILALLAQAYLSPGDEAVISQYGFLTYHIATLAAGGSPVVAQETDETANVDSLLAAVGSRTRLLYLANPNNPTGTCLPYREVQRLHAALPGNVLLVLDAAYADYVQRDDYASGAELALQSQNVVMTRTFSKAFGLANLRLGWACAPTPVIDALNRTRSAFNVGGPAQAAGIAALADLAHLQRVVDHNSRWLAWLYHELTALGLRVTPSTGNFLLIHFPSGSQYGAAAADRFLRHHGLVLRTMHAYSLPNALRASVGSEEANRKLIAALAEFLAANAHSAA